MPVYPSFLSRAGSWLSCGRFVVGWVGLGLVVASARAPVYMSQHSLISNHNDINSFWSYGMETIGQRARASNSASESERARDREGNSLAGRVPVCHPFDPPLPAINRHATPPYPKVKTKGRLDGGGVQGPPRRLQTKHLRLYTKPHILPRN